jgi:catechol 2,3-dioxygenase-like lactoylglutathione lyase family enzyme
MSDHQITRRQVLSTLPALALQRRLAAQSNAQPIRVRSFSHMTLTVSDRKRSVEFYQGLFGLAIQHRQDISTGLRIGSGPQYISLAQGGPNAKPAIAHYCMTVENFSVDGITKMLADHGVTKGSPGPMKTWVRMRGPNAGGAPEGTPELYVGDPDGINAQLQDVSYCGGGGVQGNVCKPPEPAPTKGLIALRDLSHFTLAVSDRERSTAFYQDLFGMPIQVHQGVSPLLAVGSKRQFITIAGVNGARAGVFNIAHGCFTMEGFNPDQVLKALADYGIKPRGSASGPPGPLVSYVSMRMEDRGGAKGGTPELYFTDPDGILMQIQDVSYCGGAGYFGEACSAS